MPAWELILRLLAVGAVFAVAMWALRRYAARQPKPSSRMPRSMRVLSKVALGRGSNVCLVEVGDQAFLVGVNAQAVAVNLPSSDFDEHASEALALASKSVLNRPVSQFEAALHAALNSTADGSVRADRASETSPRATMRSTGPVVLPTLGVSADARSTARRSHQAVPSVVDPSSLGTTGADSAAQPRVKPSGRRKPGPGRKGSPAKARTPARARKAAPPVAEPSPAKERPAKTKSTTSPSTRSRSKAAADSAAAEVSTQLPPRSAARAAVSETALPSLPPAPAKRPVRFSVVADRYRDDTAASPAGKTA